MKLRTATLMSGFVTLIMTAPAFAASIQKLPDLYVVNFSHQADPNSQKLQAVIPTAIRQSGINAEHVTIDTSTGAKWTKGAHEAFDRDIVPVFNKWVGLPGFAAVVDAKTKQVLGCVRPEQASGEIASDIRKLASKANNQPHFQQASSMSSSPNACPEAYNKLPQPE